MTPALVAALNAKMPELPDPPTMPGMAKYGFPTEITGVPTVGVGIPVSQMAAPAAPAAPEPAPAAPEPAPAAPEPAPELLPTPTPSNVANMPTVHAPSAVEEPKTAFEPVHPRQAGGARNEFNGGPGPAIAGVLTAVVIAGGLKGFYDIISKQYG